MDFKELARQIHKNSIAKGWWDTPREIPELLCLVHSEVSEGLEGYRNNIPEGSKGCLSEELADATIRLMDMAEGLGLDLEAAIIKKHGYNKTRSLRHGGKKC